MMVRLMLLGFQSQLMELMKPRLLESVESQLSSNSKVRNTEQRPCH